MQTKDIWVVIPAHNEEHHISKVVGKVRRYCSNIVVVDDGSKDNTYDLALKSGAIVLKHVVNLGKGAAVKTGADYAVSNGANALIFMDSDGQHEAKDIPRFVEALEDVDIVYGSRRRSKSMPGVLRFGNRVISTVLKILYDVNVSDSQSGYRALKAYVYEKIKWKANDYGMESEMIANASRAKLKYKEIFIKTLYSDKYKGTTVLDGVKIVLQMLWWRISR